MNDTDLTVNCEPLDEMEISDWLRHQVSVRERVESGGSWERPLKFRDLEICPIEGESGDQLVADFTHAEVAISTGEVFRFVAALPNGEEVPLKATAYPEWQQGRRIVVFEVEPVL